MYIKDLMSGTVRKYGTNHHDSLRISSNGRFLTYENLQCGEGSRFGEYRFVTNEQGKIPQDDEVLAEYGADAYFNIGGFDQEVQLWRDFDKWLKEVALGEEQYKVLMAEFYKDYGITLEAGDTYTTDEVTE